MASRSRTQAPQRLSNEDKYYDRDEPRRRGEDLSQYDVEYEEALARRLADSMNALRLSESSPAADLSRSSSPGQSQRPSFTKAKEYFQDREPIRLAAQGPPARGGASTSMGMRRDEYYRDYEQEEEDHRQRSRRDREREREREMERNEHQLRLLEAARMESSTAVPPARSATLMHRRATAAEMVPPSSSRYVQESRRPSLPALHHHGYDYHDDDEDEDQPLSHSLGPSSSSSSASGQASHQRPMRYESVSLVSRQQNKENYPSSSRKRPQGLQVEIPVSNMAYTQRFFFPFFSLSKRRILHSCSSFACLFSKL
jgi:hypothetical protein